MASTYINLPQIGLEDESLIALENITVTVSNEVEIANDLGNPIPVSGPVTDAELRASPVDVSGPLTDAELRATAVPVSAASLPLPSGAATSALQLPDNHQVSANQNGTWNVTNISGTVSLPTGAATEASLSSVASLLTPRAVVMDEASSTVTYVGKAAAGTATSSASWQIFRITTGTPSLQIEYADGDILFNNVWDNRASLSYS